MYFYINSLILPQSSLPPQNHKPINGKIQTNNDCKDDRIITERFYTTQAYDVVATTSINYLNSTQRLYTSSLTCYVPCSAVEASKIINSTDAGQLA